MTHGDSGRTKYKDNYSLHVTMFHDLSCFSFFLSEFASKNGGKLPSSWDELIDKDIIKRDGHFYRFNEDYDSLQIHHPDRFGWIADANLNNYDLVNGKVVEKNSGQQGTLLWPVWPENADYPIDNVFINVEMFNRSIMESWMSSQTESVGEKKGTSSTSNQSPTLR